MPNHFYLVVETPQANLVTAMKWFLGTYPGEAAGGTAAELRRRRKSDPTRVTLARRLRAQTTMKLHWLAGRLAMDAAGSAAQCLREAKNGKRYAILRD
jgi:hypothetical protein